MGIEIGLEVARHLVISMVFLGCSWHIGDAAGSDASLKVFLVTRLISMSPIMVSSLLYSGIVSL